MFCERIQGTLPRAVYEDMDDEEPCYGEVSELLGIWVAGKSEVDCRENLRLAI